MNLCLNCRRRNRTCVCVHIKPFKTNSRFIILMHPMEFKKEKVGTGRFSHLILENSEVIVDIGFDENKRFIEVLNDPEYTSYVLYPGFDTIDLGSENLQERLGTKKGQFIVIDGTWPCAKKMMRLTTSLHAVPRVSFTTGRLSEFRVKHQPLPGCLSTVESIHQVLLDLNRAGIENTNDAHENLMDVFRKSVDRQIEIAMDPASQSGYRNRPFKLDQEKRISKKYQERLLFFKDV